MQKLSFCNVNIISKDIAEIIFDDGVEISLEMVSEFVCFITANMDEYISVLLNKATTYSYQIDAIRVLSELDRIKHIAVVTYDDVSTTASEYMKKQYNNSGKCISIFGSKDAALNWLNSIPVECDT